MRHRRSIRLRDFDYSTAGAYFVTVCAQGRSCLFGEVVDGAIRLNEAGRMVAEQWNAVPVRFPTVEVDALVVMPNHLHAIVAIHDVATGGDGTAVGVGAPLVGARVTPTGAVTRATTRVAPTLGDVIGAFKSTTTLQYTRAIHSLGWPPFLTRLWRRNYYEHVIRDHASLDRHRQYIADNPARWSSDPENPANIPR